MMIGMPREAGRHEQGMALVGLILVLAMIGILAAVSATSLVKPAADATSSAMVAPNTNLVAPANATGCTEELRAVQTAMDVMMAVNSVSAVTAQTAATATFIALPVGSGVRPLAPTYLRQGTTKGSYTWTASGLVSAATTGGCR
jgi:type II secretory pathway pseudopilin PulG